MRPPRHAPLGAGVELGGAPGGAASPLICATAAEIAEAASVIAPGMASLTPLMPPAVSCTELGTASLTPLMPLAMPWTALGMASAFTAGPPGPAGVRPPYSAPSSASRPTPKRRASNCTAYAEERTKEAANEYADVFSGRRGRALARSGEACWCPLTRSREAGRGSQIAPHSRRAFIWRQARVFEPCCITLAAVLRHIEN